MAVLIQHLGSSTSRLGYPVVERRERTVNNEVLSAEQAFHAMFNFLVRYYNRTGQKGDLAAVLSDIQTVPSDGMPADPAVWADWLAAIKGVLEKSSR
jgi:hypothetical protein